VSPVLALALAVAAAGPPPPVAARLDGIALVAFEGRVAIRINYTGRPGPVSVARSGNVARVTLPRTDLGWRFGAGRRFEWRPGAAPMAAFASADRSLEGLRIEAGRGETSLIFDLPPAVSVEVRRVRYALLVVLREGEPSGTLAAQAAPPPAPTTPLRESAPPKVEPEPVATPAPEPARLAAVSPEPPQAEVASAPPPAPPTPEDFGPVAAPAPRPETTVGTADLYRQLFPPAASSDPAAPEADDVQALYSRLFPASPTEATSTGDELQAFGDAGEPADGFRVGPFRLKPFFTASYVHADASLLSTPGVVTDGYFQFEPGVAALAPLGLGTFTAEYAPAFRAGASFEATQEATHALTGTLDLPFAADSQLTVTDRFLASTLDTREVDPGGEYFFDLAPFRRNQVSANARLSVGPRLYLELGGAFASTSFDRPGGFFDYESRLGSAGVGYELSPNLRATVTYVYDDVPQPEERPEAEASAHSVLFALQGDLLPLLTGRLAVGFRDQETPNADREGRSFQGLAFSGSLTREFGRESTLSLLLNRSTPVSNFEQNGFYVNTMLSASVTAPVPASLSLDAGLGYSWNGYRVDALEIGVPREDGIFSLYAGLRRRIGQKWWASAFYRRERRRSNLDAFDVTSDGVLLQVSWGLFGPRR